MAGGEGGLGAGAGGADRVQRVAALAPRTALEQVVGAGVGARELGPRGSLEGEQLALGGAVQEVTATGGGVTRARGLAEGVARAVEELVGERAHEVGAEVGALGGRELAALHYQLGDVAVVAGAGATWARREGARALVQQRARHHLQLVRVRVAPVDLGEGVSRGLAMFRMVVAVVVMAVMMAVVAMGDTIATQLGRREEKRAGVRRALWRSLATTTRHVPPVRAIVIARHRRLTADLDHRQRHGRVRAPVALDVVAGDG